MSTGPPSAVRVVEQAGAAEHLVHPLRQAILEQATEPLSATELGELLGESRQKVNYHLHVLVEAGLMAPAGSRPVGNLIEKLYQATARAYLVSPSALGGVAPDLATATDRFSAATLLALTARIQQELGRVLDQAEEEGSRVATLSIGTTVHFEDPEQRARFTEALQEAVVRVVEEHTSLEGPGTRPFRLVLGAHPVPRAEGEADAAGLSRAASAARGEGDEDGRSDR